MQPSSVLLGPIKDAPIQGIGEGAGAGQQQRFLLALRIRGEEAALPVAEIQPPVPQRETLAGALSQQLSLPARFRHPLDAAGGPVDVVEVVPVAAEILGDAALRQHGKALQRALGPGVAGQRRRPVVAEVIAIEPAVLQKGPVGVEKAGHGLGFFQIQVGQQMLLRRGRRFRRLLRLCGRGRALRRLPAAGGEQQREQKKDRDQTGFHRRLLSFSQLASFSHYNTGRRLWQSGWLAELPGI